MNEEIRKIAKRMLTTTEISELQDLSKAKRDIFLWVKEFDMRTGGAGIHNINVGNSGRYDIKDRDVFRPIQYIYAYLKMNHADLNWVTREIVHMSGLHLESLIKRIVARNKIPLGQALALPLAKLKLNNQLYFDLKAMLKPYNYAKHHMSHKENTHLFNVESALLYYAVTRKLAVKLMMVSFLTTSLEIWNSYDLEPIEEI